MSNDNISPSGKKTVQHLCYNGAGEGRKKTTTDSFQPRRDEILETSRASIHVTKNHPSHLTKEGQGGRQNVGTQGVILSTGNRACPRCGGVGLREQDEL
jgi:hypothetical protein